MYKQQKYLMKHELSNIDDSIVQILINGKGFVCGGAVRSIFSNSKINDFDVYFKSEKDFDYVRRRFKELGDITYDTPLATSFDINDSRIQLIKLTDCFDETTEGFCDKLFNMFDFTCCCAIYDIDKDVFILHKDFLVDNLSKVLKFNSKTRYPLSSLMRVRKYLSYGFTISAIELLKIAMAIRKLDLTDPKVLKDQLTGIDVAILRPVLDDLKDRNSKIDLEDFVDKLETIIDMADIIQD